MSLISYLLISLAPINATINAVINIIVGYVLFGHLEIVYIFKSEKNFITDIFLTAAIAVWISHYIAYVVTKNQYQKVDIGTRKTVFYNFTKKIQLHHRTKVKVFVFGLLFGLVFSLIFGVWFKFAGIVALFFKTAIQLKFLIAFIVSYIQLCLSGFYYLKHLSLGDLSAGTQ